MSMPFVMCGYAAALLLMLFGFRGVRRSTPDLRGSRQLSWFIVCALFGILLIGLHPWIPVLLSVVLANFLLFAGAMCIYLATTHILEKSSRVFPWPGGPLIVALPLFVWFTYGNDWAAARLLIHVIVIGSIYLTASVFLFRQRATPEARQPARACASLLVLATSLQVAWCILEFRVVPRGTSFAHPNLMDVGFSYLSMVLALATVIALLWLALTMHRLALHKMAQTDSLTGLLNRRAFEEILRRDLMRSDMDGNPMGIMLIDLDYFKQVNDSLGHFAGDDVLRRIALVLRDGTRPSDVLARYGGEEFVVLLRQTGVEESQTAAERIRQAIANLSGLPGDVKLTASIGVAVSNSRDAVTEFLLRADDALYRSKRQGRNLVSVYQESEEEIETPSPL